MNRYINTRQVPKAQRGEKTLAPTLPSAAATAVGGDKTFGLKRKDIHGGNVVGGMPVSAPKHGDTVDMGSAYYRSMRKVAPNTRKTGMSPEKIAAIRAQESRSGRNLTDEQIIAEYGDTEFAGERSPLNMGVASKYATSKYNEQEGLWEVTTNKGMMLPNAGEYLQKLNPGQRYRVDGKGGMVYNRQKAAAVAAASRGAGSRGVVSRRRGGILYSLSE